MSHVMNQTSSATEKSNLGHMIVRSLFWYGTKDNYIYKARISVWTTEGGFSNHLVEFLSIPDCVLYMNVRIQRLLSNARLENIV